MPCTVVVGGFFGDEGKGKIISYLAVRDRVDVAARGGVGTNAGHSVTWNGRTYRLRMIPSAFPNPETKLLIGPGVLVDQAVLLKEIEETKAGDRTRCDPNCAIIEPEHIREDRESAHLKGKIGTTGTGCGPCNVDRVRRVARTASDVPALKPYLADVPRLVNEAIGNGRRVLVEGTQGTFLSLYHGTYPYVTSKDVTAASICADVGVGPTKIDGVLVVFKAYVTRVGAGPLDGELSEQEADARGWTERGTVTGRRRRVAPFNFDLARRAVMLNGATSLAVTKLDLVFPECRGKTDFGSLPGKAVDFVKNVENETRIPVHLIGTGPSVEEVIDRRNESECPLRRQNR